MFNLLRSVQISASIMTCIVHWYFKDANPLARNVLSFHQLSPRVPAFATPEDRSFSDQDQRPGDRIRFAKLKEKSLMGLVVASFLLPYYHVTGFRHYHLNPGYNDNGPSFSHRIFSNAPICVMNWGPGEGNTYGLSPPPSTYRVARSSSSIRTFSPGIARDMFSSVISPLKNKQRR